MIISLQSLHNYCISILLHVVGTATVAIVVALSTVDSILF